MGSWVKSTFFVGFMILFATSCGGEVSLTVAGCESCPERCLQDSNGRGRCVRCLQDKHCQSKDSPSRKCTQNNQCVCGSDKDCPVRQFCKGTSGCVECLSDKHCLDMTPDRPYCLSNRCEICERNQIRACVPEGVNACKKGTQTCTSSGIWNECKGWSVCQSGEVCRDEKCVLSNCPPSQCKEGSTTCTSSAGVVPGTYRRCERDAGGCFSWKGGLSCGKSEVCDNGACKSKGCPAASCKESESRCVSTSEYEVCEKNSDGCFVWSSPKVCAVNTSCSAGGKCESTSTSCKSGDVRPCYGGPTKTQNVGICKSGQSTCKADGSGFGPCVGDVRPQTESCNSKDDNCDGKIDNIATTSCKTILPGICANGTRICRGGQISCLPAAKRSEVCDRLDNDCDGQTDEGLTRSCGGRHCKGTESCVNGRWANCNAPKAIAEICDGKDNDCDGRVDENIAVKTCYTGPTVTVGKGPCKQGRESCQNGKSVCVGEVTPVAEVCNDRKDNDCDGLIDEVCGPCAAGRALNLPGSAYVQFPTSKGTFQIRNSLTIEAWVYPTALPPYPGNSRIISKGPLRSAAEDYMLYLCTNECQRSTKPYASSFLKDRFGRTQKLVGRTIPMRSWTHIAATYNNNFGKLYVNGVLVLTKSTSGPLTATSSHRFEIGRSGAPAGDYFVGKIDEVRVWNVERSQTQIQQGMRNRLTGNEPGLVGYWNFDSGTANDSTTNSNHGSLRGGATTVSSSGKGWCP